ncbi:MAG: 16S rRNA (adenine(1518)-N(6)/adenine(1519)-N(6))-dimethyltransferase, partial [Stenotrophomonas bentonitica]
RNALQNVCTPEQFDAAGVRSDARAEQLDVAQFIALANVPYTDGDDAAQG